MLSNKQRDDTLEQIFNAIKANDINALEALLLKIDWQPNKIWSLSFGDYLQKDEMFIENYYVRNYNLLSIAVACYNLPVIEWVLSKGEEQCLGELFSYADNPSLFYALIQCIGKAPNNTVCPLPLLLSLLDNFILSNPNAEHINKTVEVLVTHEMNDVIDALRVYIPSFAIDNIEQWSVDGTLAGRLKYSDFDYAAIAKVATQYVDHIFSEARLDNHYLEQFVVPFLTHHVGEYPTPTNVSQYVDLQTCDPLTVIALFDQRITSTVDPFFYGYRIPKYNPEKMALLFERATTAIPQHQFIENLIKYKDDENVLVAMTSNQIRYSLSDYSMAISAIVREAFRYKAEAFAVLMRIAKTISPLFPEMEEYLDISTYNNWQITPDNRDKMAQLDWSVLSTYFKAPTLPQLKMALSVKEQIRSIMDTALLPLWPLLIIALIKEKGVETIGAQMQRKEWLTAFLLCVSPMEALPYLPKRAQKRILVNLA